MIVLCEQNYCAIKPRFSKIASSPCKHVAFPGPRKNQNNMAAVPLVGLTGAKGAGKSTAAACLVSSLGYTETSFALPLKRACGAMFGFTAEQMEDQVLKETVDKRWGVTPRKALQCVGTQLVRERMREAFPDLWLKEGESFWVKAFEMVYRDHVGKGGGPLVVSDVRFENEAEAVRKLGGIIVRVRREGGDASEAKDTHVSETEMQRILADAEVVNVDGDVTQLYTELESAVRADTTAAVQTA